MTLTSGDKTVQLAAVIAGLYVAGVGYLTKNWLLVGIGLATSGYDGYLYFTEPTCVCKKENKHENTEAVNTPL